MPAHILPRYFKGREREFDGKKEFFMIDILQKRF